MKAMEPYECIECAERSVGEAVVDVRTVLAFLEGMELAGESSTASTYRMYCTDALGALSTVRDELHRTRVRIKGDGDDD